MMAPFIVAILLGAVTAIICYPVYAKLLKSLKPPFAALAVTGSLTVGILCPVFFVVYTSAYRLLQLIKRLQLDKGEGLQFISDPWIQSLTENLSFILPMDREWLKGQFLDLVQNTVEKSSQVIGSALSGMPGLMIGFVVIMLSLYFCLLDGERLLKFALKLSPTSPEKAGALYHAFEGSCRGVIIGLFLSAGAQGFLILLFFLITHLPDPLLFGAIGMGMGMVPIVGTVPIWATATLYLFGQKAIALGILMLIGGFIISISDNVIRAWFLHGTSKMHPFLALVSVMGALNLVGPAGIFLGPIIAAVFVSFLRLLSSETKSHDSEPDLVNRV